MTSVLRYAAVAVFISSVSGFAIIAAATSTAPWLVDNISPAPTEAPELDLVRAKLAKRAVTNICTEWTVPGGLGQPQCSNSETCLFYSTTISGLEYDYEGCGETSIKYNWITECFNYGEQIGSVPISQTYCPSTAQQCGYYAFVFAADYTYYNYGCDSTSYAYFAQLIATEADNGTSSSSSAVLQTAIPGTASASTTASAINAQIITVTSIESSGSASSATGLPNIGSHYSTSSTPTGAIAGGVVGGAFVLAIVGLLYWCCFRSRRQKRANATQHAQVQQGPPPTAYYQPGNNNIPEIAGTAKPMTGYTPASAAYAEKPANGGIPFDPRLSGQSPPPIYSGNMQQQQQQYPQQYSPPQPHTSPPNRPPSPVHRYSELSQESATGTGQRLSAQPPVSPASTAMHPQSPPLAASELMGGGSYQQGGPHQGVNELGAGSQVPQEISGASTGGISRPAQGARPVRYDMSGNPMHEEFRPLEME